MHRLFATGRMFCFGLLCSHCSPKMLCFGDVSLLSIRESLPLRNLWVESKSRKYQITLVKESPKIQEDSQILTKEPSFSFVLNSWFFKNFSAKPMNHIEETFFSWVVVITTWFLFDSCPEEPTREVILWWFLVNWLWFLVSWLKIASKA